MSTVEKKIVCWASPGCHENCGLIATIEDGRLVKLRGNSEYPTPHKGCADRMPHHMKWLYSDKQVLYPLKRVGERGEGQWEQITWEQALDEIAEKLKIQAEKYGPETLAVCEGTYRNDMYPMRTRFLNLFGNPSNVGCSGTVCFCNTAALSYAVLGTSPGNGQTDRAKCIVVHGNDQSQTDPLQWRSYLKRKDRPKIILIDPRYTEQGKDADIWLRLRPGTDTAILMGWIHVIIKEGLIDKEFIDEWVYGYDELAARAEEYTPEKVEEITWVPKELIIESARMYATNYPAVLKFGSATDMIGRNSIRVDQARIALRAITGNLKVGGGETAEGPGPFVNGKMAVRDSMLQLEDKLPVEQRKKMIGSDRFKLMMWPAYEILAPIYEKTYGIPWPMCTHNFISNQPLIWNAILNRDPYPVTANITWGSNPLLNGGNVKYIYKALTSPNLELSVVLDHWLTPSAMLADYVLPAASKLEKPVCHTHEDFAPNFAVGERAVEPLGDRHEEYLFWKGLAERLGFGEYFPWENEEALADYRLKPVGTTFKEAATEKYFIHSDEPWTYEKISPYTGEKTGFATPTGKIEVYSTVLEQLGYDPLPYYEEPAESPVSTPELTPEYPLVLTTGGNFRPMFHSENRQLGIGTREQYPEPIMDIHPDTAKEHGIADGDWVYVESPRGVIKQKARVADEIDPRVINVQSHWWFPEQPARIPWLGGLWESNCNVLTQGDDPDTFDQVTGGWPLRALLCRIYKVEEAEQGKRSPV
ncbi:MAG: molybdopterin-dependent oxidoreductase [Clostridiales Family XIII bacterium]|jgi:anaerobic selenocysteine-containing dehydrogenase|nr:molybdopterin-dependent oxidoreductase [Clostridiales Family XIII bacterium]